MLRCTYLVLRRRGATFSNRTHAEPGSCLHGYSHLVGQLEFNSLVLAQGLALLLPAELWKNLGAVELFWFPNGRQQLRSCLRTYLTGGSGGEMRDKTCSRERAPETSAAIDCFVLPLRSTL